MKNIIILLVDISHINFYNDLNFIYIEQIYLEIFLKNLFSRNDIKTYFSSADIHKQSKKTNKKAGVF